jgi:type II secretory pathway pseudopilin PulG
MAKSRVLPAPEPASAEVGAWKPLLDAAFPPQPNSSPETRLVLGYLASEARRACVPALSEAVYERVRGEKPEARRTAAGAIFGDAWALYGDESRWGKTAPFILLYLEQARRLRSTDLVDREDVAAIARARLLAVDAAPVAPRPRAAPSAETLRRLREASAARRAASAARSAEYERTRADMVVIGNALEAYRGKEKRFPEGDFASVRERLREFAARDLPGADAWGTRFRYEGGPGGSTYRVWSAGSDRRFGELPPITSPIAKVPFESDDPAGDIVMIPGAWLREWSSMARFQPSPDPQAAPTDPARTAHGRALAEIRRVGDAIGQYRSDHGKFPDVGSRLAEGTIPGVYISKVPTLDPWGTEYQVSWSADRKHFRIVSAGADRVFEKLGGVDPGAAWGTPSLATDPNRDVVFQDGVFLQAYRDSR